MPKKKQKINPDKFKVALVCFNRTLNQIKQDPITLDQYIDYVYGKPLPSKATTVEHNQIPTYTGYERDHRHIKSVDMIGNHQPTKTSKTDAYYLSKETPAVRDEIVAKSKRIALAYNKGAYQFITDEANLETRGRKV